MEIRNKQYTQNVISSAIDVRTKLHERIIKKFGRG